MNPYMASGAINTKVASRIKHILNKDEWNKILNCSTVEQIIDYLKEQKYFKDAIKDLKIDNINRDSFEATLGKVKTNRIEDLLNYFSGPYKEFVKSMLIDLEISDISLLLRKISRGEALNDIEKRFVHSEKHTVISFEKLLSSNSVENFVLNLKDTPYFIGLRNLSHEDAINREFHIEMKLQDVFYKTMLSKADKLSVDDTKTAKEIIGFKIDLENIQWIYRAVKYYKISPEEILIYSLEGGSKINYKRMKALCYAKSIDEFKQLVISYFRYDIFEGVADSDSDISIDYHMLNFLKNKNYDNIGSIITYVYTLGIIIDDITAVTEGIKYNVPRDELKQYLAYKI